MDNKHILLKSDEITVLILNVPNYILKSNLEYMVKTIKKFKTLTNVKIKENPRMKDFSYELTDVINYKYL